MTEKMDLAKRRLVNLFQFIKEYSLRRYPAPKNMDYYSWKLWFSDLPDHPAVKREYLTESSSEETESIVTVCRPQITKPPKPPVTIVEWLRPGWDDPEAGEISTYPAKNIDGPNGEAIEEKFEDDKKRVQDFELWKQEWFRWAENERPSREALRVFERLYELYGILQRESEQVELVVGDGILSWGPGIYHPLLLLKIQLEFNAKIPEFRIIDLGEPPEFYTALFVNLPEISSQDLGKLITEHSESSFYPLGLQDTSGFLRRIVKTLSPAHGEFVEEGEITKGVSPHPAIGRKPVLFLRRRTQGFAKALEKILADLAKRADHLAWIARIVGVEPEPAMEDSFEQGRSRASTEGSSGSSDDSEVLFSKPHNKEQLQIADQLNRHAGVIVQGPPGTGKTHTISNLIGHLLAQGKTVLVTAHTTKALKVLRDQIVEPLRPLCVSLLDNDLESRKQLEEAVNHISEYLTRSDSALLEAEAKKLFELRRKLLEEIRGLDQRIFDAINSEYREIVIAGETFEPAQAARFVAQGKGQHDWIPGPVEIGQPLLLSMAEVVELYQSNRLIAPEDEKETIGLPTPQELIPPEEFNQLVGFLKRPLDTNSAELWRSGTQLQPEVLEELAEQIDRIGHELQDAQPWELLVAEAGLKGGANVGPWERLLELAAAIMEQAAESQELLFLQQPRLAPDISLEEQKRLAEMLAEETGKSGKKINGFLLRLNPSKWRFVQGTQVASGHPKGESHFRALAILASLTKKRKDLLSLWDGLIVQKGGPSLESWGEEPERGVNLYSGQIQYWLSFYEASIKPLLDKLRRVGFDWEFFSRRLRQDPLGQLDILGNVFLTRLLPILRGRALETRQLQATLRIDSVKLYLERLFHDGSSLGKDLYEAILEKDVEAYAKTYQRIEQLYSSQTLLNRRRELLTRLERVAPNWAKMIRLRVGIHGHAEPPGDPVAAWRWQQLNDKLDELASTSVPELQERVKERREKLQRITAELIEKRTWARQRKRTTLSGQQALYSGPKKSDQKMTKAKLQSRHEKTLLTRPQGTDRTGNAQ